MDTESLLAGGQRFINFLATSESKQNQEEIILVSFPVAELTPVLIASPRLAILPSLFILNTYFSLYVF